MYVWFSIISEEFYLNHIIEQHQGIVIGVPKTQNVAFFGNEFYSKHLLRRILNIVHFPGFFAVDAKSHTAMETEKKCENKIMCRSDV